jgi:hypothetical protein
MDILMGYKSPNAELILLPKENIFTASGCTCQISVQQNNMTINEVGCSADTGDASENTWSIPAPDWDL